MEAGRCENHYQVSGETPGREGVVSSVWGWGSGLWDASGRGAGGGGGGLGGRRGSGTCSLSAWLGRGYSKFGEPTGSGWVGLRLNCSLSSHSSSKRSDELNSFLKQEPGGDVSFLSEVM